MRVTRTTGVGVAVAVALAAAAAAASAQEAPDYTPTTPPAGDFRTDETPTPSPTPTQIRTLHSF